MAELPDKAAAEYLPALKCEYTKLLDEQSAQLSLHDQFKTLAAHFQQRMDSQLDKLTDSFKNLLTTNPPPTAPSAQPAVPAPPGVAPSGVPTPTLPQQPALPQQPTIPQSILLQQQGLTPSVLCS